jgi:hypothetical protein
MKQDKLQKLRNLRDRSQNLAEAQAAARALQKALAKAGLTEADIAIENGQKLQFSTTITQNRGWKKRLLFCVAHVNGGTLIHQPAHGGGTQKTKAMQYLVLEKGKEARVLALHQRLVQEVIHLTKLEQEARGFRDRSYTMQFQQGVVQGLWEALKQATAEEQAAYKGGSEIVAHVEAERMAYVQEVIGKTRRSASSTRKSAAFYSGVDAARGVNLQTAGSLEQA